MMELQGFDLLVPAIVSGLIVVARQFTAKLDGNQAYMASVVLNVVAQVAAALLDGGALAGAAATGLATGAVVGPGLVATSKRVGMAKLVKPKREGA
jgi:hypothetical protein